LGLPTRVAVGFTPGQVDPDGAYRILARNAHAWPEVYIGNAGWVAFEPTPGRGIPGAQDYTGVATPAPPGEEGTGSPESTAETVPPTDSGEEIAPSSPNSSTPANPAEKAAPDSINTPTIPVETSPRWWTVGLITFAVVLAGLAGIYIARRRRRASRRAAATTPNDRVLVAWAEATETLATMGLGPQPWETPTEFARRGGVALVAANNALGTLADAVCVASYQDDQIETALAARAAESSESIVRTVATTRGALRWALSSVDPRTLWRSGR
ncbi:MAG: DUF4129 domain-containing transglutaminase family protein, partial [Pseudonocardiaceae bacterium]